MLTFKIHYSTDTQYYVTVVGANNRTILTSETYRSKQGALKGTRAVTKSMVKGSYKIVDKTI